MPLPPNRGDGSDEGRTALAVHVASPVGPILLVTTQLNSAASASAIRLEQVDAVADLVARQRVGSFPPIVTGDFKAQPESDEIRRFEGHLTAPAVPGQLLVDAWRYAEPGRCGLTWNRRNPHVLASLEPSARIDYIFVGPPEPDRAHPAGRGRCAVAAHCRRGGGFRH